MGRARRARDKAALPLPARLDRRGLRLARRRRDPAFTETHAYAPNSPYAASKAASDHLVRAYHHTYGLPVLTTNCSNNYGPCQFPEKLIPLMITQRARGQAAAGLRRRPQRARLALRGGSLRGDPRWCWKGAGAGETYNIGGDSEKTNLEVVQTLCALLDEARPRAERALRRPDRDGEGPAGPRPPLRDRRRQDRARARLAAARELRIRDAQDRGLVPSGTGDAIA